MRKIRELGSLPSEFDFFNLACFTVRRSFIVCLLFKEVPYLLLVYAVKSINYQCHAAFKMCLLSKPEYIKVLNCSN